MFIFLKKSQFNAEETGNFVSLNVLADDHNTSVMRIPIVYEKFLFIYLLSKHRFSNECWKKLSAAVFLPVQ